MGSYRGMYLGRPARTLFHMDTPTQGAWNLVIALNNNLYYDSSNGVVSFLFPFFAR